MPGRAAVRNGNWRSIRFQRIQQYRVDWQGSGVGILLGSGEEIAEHRHATSYVVIAVRGFQAA
jgi:hypothetical protein